MNIRELNAILYYADYLSLRETSTPVTDNCKYYFIYNIPMNVATTCNSMPFYDTNNKFYKLAVEEYNKIKSTFGEDAVENFLGLICNLQPLGTVNAKQMLKCIHFYSSLIDRARAFITYKNWKKSQKYTHYVLDEEGNYVVEQCSRYVAHAERDSSQVVYKDNNR